MVSHDAELLDLVGITCELTPQGLKVYGGNFAFCREQRQAEEAALERQVASAEAALQLARRKAREIRERQEKRMRAGERHKDGLPRILRKTFKDSGERTDSRLGDKHAGLVDDARQRLGELRRRRREACELKIDFDDARLHDGKLLVSARGVNVEHTPGHPLWRVPIDLEVRSGERILLAGDNGSGKTTLVRLLAGELQPSSGQVVRTAFSHVWLDQEYGMAATPRSVLELAQCHNSGGLPEHGLKMRLHRALFPEAMWDKRCDTLSGGERMRLCLCCLELGSRPACPRRTDQQPRPREPRHPCPRHCRVSGNAARRYPRPAFRPRGRHHADGGSASAGIGAFPVGRFSPGLWPAPWKKRAKNCKIRPDFVYLCM